MTKLLVYIFLLLSSSKKTQYNNKFSTRISEFKMKIETNQQKAGLQNLVKVYVHLYLILPRCAKLKIIERESFISNTQEVCSHAKFLLRYIFYN